MLLFFFLGKQLQEICRDLFYDQLHTKSKKKNEARKEIDQTAKLLKNL